VEEPGNRVLAANADATCVFTHADRAREVLRIESIAVATVGKQLDATIFDTVVDTLLQSAGRTILCGIGKSGLIAKKIAATLASTGTPSFFMHPAEAYHGDLGMINREDHFIALSYSGETEELVRLLPFLQDNGNCTIAMTGHDHSTLARHVHYHLSVHVDREACPLQLAPTASTTATLAMGDALAMALMQARHFQPHHFARLHPGGSLGRRLLRTVRDDMYTDNLPIIAASSLAETVLGQMTQGHLGLTIISDDGRCPQGIITDGDLRRALQQHREHFFHLTARDMMTADPQVIHAECRMDQAIDLMTQQAITALIVVDQTGIIGVVKK
jgi:arabinose-5-phosphate isomerase